MVNIIGIYFSITSGMAGGFPPFDDPETQGSFISRYPLGLSVIHIKLAEG